MRKMHVLLIEDNKGDARLIREILWWRFHVMSNDGRGDSIQYASVLYHRETIRLR
jgi:hypothetical protein